MGKPTDEEFEHALAAAKAMREEGIDTHHVAKALLSLNFRFNHWQRVIKALKLYLHSGGGTTEHAKLVHLLHEVERIEDSPETDFGLE